MVAVGEAVVGGEDDGCVFVEADLLQRLEDVADPVIDHGGLGEIGGPSGRIAFARRIGQNLLQLLEINAHGRLSGCESSVVASGRSGSGDGAGNSLVRAYPCQGIPTSVLYS